MRRSLVPAVHLAALLTAPGVLAVGKAAEAPAGQPAVEQTTRIEGTVPDLVGRWLVAAEVALPEGGGVAVVTPQLWDVSVEGGKTTLEVRRVRLPATVLDAVAAANAQHRGWEPSDADLRRLRDGWQALAPEDRGLAGVETVIMGRDAFSAETKADEKMRDALFVIQQTLSYRPGPGRPIRDAMLHGATEPTPLGYRGNYASVSLVAGVVAVPVAFSGTFRMYRLESLPAPGLLARLLDGFAGCARRER